MTQKGIKWLFGIIAMSLVLFVSCDRRNQKASVSDTTFNEYVTEDFNYAKSLVDTTAEGSTLFFYEVECTTNGSIATTAPDSLNITTMRTVFQIDTVVYLRDRNFETMELADTSAVGTWMGSFAMDSTSFPVTFENAVQRLHETNIALPDANCMTLRRPLGEYKHALYIFGTNDTGFVYVDAETGEVNTIE